MSDVEAQLSAFGFLHRLRRDEPAGRRPSGAAKSVNTVLLSLAMMVAGCLVMLLAANLAIYEVVLLGLFVLASGITVLQVAANPLAAALGRPERSHFRLTFSQAFNSLGTFIGPYLGAALFLKDIEVKQGDERVRGRAQRFARGHRPRVLLDRGADHLDRDF